MPLYCDALIFDLDGVLVDSQAVIDRYWRRWADQHDISFEAIEAVYHGRTMVEVIEEVAPHLDAQAEADRAGAYTDDELEGLVAFEGAVSLLRGLPPDRWAIATSGRRRTATSRLAHTDLPRPEVLVTADDVEEGKPAPDPYCQAAEGLGVAPERCVVVEDAPAGVASARRAGASVLAVSTTAAPEALADADAIVESVADVSVESRAEGGLTVTWRAEGRRI